MKTRTILISIAAVGGLAVVATIALCAGVLVSAYRNLDATLSPTVDELFAAIDNGTFGDTYDSRTSSDLKAAVSREQYENLGLTVKTRLGPLKSKKLAQFNIRQHNANTLATVVYNATFEKGPGTISTVFRKDGDQWLLVSLHVNSPEFQKDFATVKCSRCGQPHTADAKFCPKCGKPITGGEEPE